jgi:hypothetical protein
VYVISKWGGTSTHATYNYTNLLQHLSAALTFRSLSAGHTIPNADELSIDVLQTRSDPALDAFLDLLLHETQGNWLDRVVKQVMF